MTDIEVTERAEVLTAGVRKTVPTDELTDFFSHAFAETMRVLTAQGVQPAGPPYGKYYGMPGAAVDVEAGFPVAAPVTGSGEVEPGLLPGGSVVEAVHIGPYDTLVQTYAAIEDFVAVRGLTPSDVMWESYLSDPEVEPDPATWRTLISWPVTGEASRAPMTQ
ncbi:GyrI-like domain-containing protein [Microbacterium cremeum]|uniref:GyrI-like domain-containing protein n=1 Tax=Microbacterium cremeum TaxID=2782169 RepID=UPI001887CA74|nr:GyrI-like domain-containing protein [Microbacterium cremeum]